MVGAVAALALLSGLFHPGGSPASRPDLQVQHYRVTGWRLEVRRDRFTDVAACTIQRSDITYDRGLLTFRFGHRIDTANALFRVDDGPVRTAGSVAVKAAGMGARFNGPNLANPSDGEVHIPADDVAQAARISIKPNSKMTHRTFDLTGLSNAIETAKAKGCDIT
jgi:hypothetical protein